MRAGDSPNDIYKYTVVHPSCRECHHRYKGICFHPVNSYGEELPPNQTQEGSPSWCGLRGSLRIVPLSKMSRKQRDEFER